jgi:ATP-binding cassette subfamily B protein
MAVIPGVAAEQHAGLKQDARLAFVRMLHASSPRLTYLLVLLLLLQAALSLAFVLASGELVGLVPDAVRDGRDSPAVDRLVRWLVVVGVTFVLQQILDPFQETLIDTLGRRLEGWFRDRAMTAVLRPSGIAHLEDPATRDLIARVRGAAQGQYAPPLALRGLVNLVQKAFTAFTATALIWIYFEWWLAIALLLILLAVRTRLRRDVFRAVGVMTGATPATRRADYFLAQALEPVAAKETRIFGLGPWIVERFTRHWAEAMEPVWAARRQGTRAVAPWTIVAVFVPVALVFVVVGRSAANGDTGIAALAIVLQSVLMMATWLFSINLPEQWFEYGAPSAVALDDLETATRGGDDRHLHTGSTLGASLAEGIRFERVRFRYPHGQADVFRDFDLEIPAGRSVAIVGTNGAGKTTLIKLLTGMYEPTEGRIALDGVDLRQIRMDDWRRKIAVIFQDFVRYELSAAENIAIGGPEPARNRAAVERAAGRSGALDIVKALAAGWDTVLSKAYQAGTDLSGGQWQRIALARALFAVEAGAEVLVLDEPTAALDIRAEADLFDRFLELTAGLTTILISHRFSTVRRADLICVLEAGQVVERGNHDDLMAARGRYARMFRYQSDRFLNEDDPDA